MKNLFTTLTLVVIVSLALQAEAQAGTTQIAATPSATDKCDQISRVIECCCHPWYLHMIHPEYPEIHGPHYRAVHPLVPTKPEVLSHAEIHGEDGFIEHMIDAGRRLVVHGPERSDHLTFHPNRWFSAGAVAHRAGFENTQGYLFARGILRDKQGQPLFSGSLSYRFTQEGELGGEGHHAENAREPKWFVGAGWHFWTTKSLPLNER